MLNRTWTAARRDLLSAAVVASLFGCGNGVDPDPNRAPSVTSAIPDQQMTEGDTVTINLASHFSDPDGDTLKYTAVTSNAGVLSASVSGSRLTLVAVGPGEATVTVTATDSGGLEATQDFDATVQHRNRAPSLTDSIPGQLVNKGDTATVDLGSHFEDPDGDSIAYEAVTANEYLVTVSVSGDELTLAGVRPGTATITVTATDPDGLAATQDFNTVVEGVNHAPEVEEEFGDVTLEQDEYVIFDLLSHFSDPDDDPLTYAVMPSDTSAVSDTVYGDTLELTSGVPGGTMVDVTATDPSGLSVTQSLSVEVDEGFSVDFTDLDTLLHWRLDSGIDATLSDDGVQLTVHDIFCGGTYKEIESSLSEWWTFNAVIGRQDSLVATYINVGIDHSRYDGYRLLVGSGMLAGGESVNYRFDADDGGVWSWLEAGFSDGLDDSGYDLNEVTLEYSESTDTLRATVDTTELFALDMEDEGLPTTVIDKAGFGLCSLSQQGGDGETAIVESGQLEGGHAYPMFEHAGPHLGPGTPGEVVRVRVFPSTGWDRGVEWPGAAAVIPAQGRRGGGGKYTAATTPADSRWR
ncbi:MAG: putative Ig domain-containing protein [Gemmatimonadota bacterium]|nr:putative Ig domain-containing protein [Gemmatimonadota bacterium]MDE2871962.1 putative Ig domain-containing protein [Gemmatimonadota bacterium]